MEFKRRISHLMEQLDLFWDAQTNGDNPSFFLGYYGIRFTDAGVLQKKNKTGIWEDVHYIMEPSPTKPLLYQVDLNAAPTDRKITFVHISSAVACRIDGKIQFILKGSGTANGVFRIGPVSLDNLNPIPETTAHITAVNTTAPSPKDVDLIPDIPGFNP